MIVYLIKVIACSAAFILIYQLLLEKDKMSHFKRFYLIGSLLLSFVIPLISWQSTNEVVNEIQPLRFWEGETPSFDLTNALIDNAEPGGIDLNNYQLQDLVVGFYLLVSVSLLIRLLISVAILARKVRKKHLVNYKGVKLVLADYCVPTHSFLHYIFLSKSDYDAGNIPEEVLHHELIHIRQKHTLDVLFIETLIVLMWFNPLLLFYKRAIHLNHEFLADEGVISRFQNVPSYQKLLVNLTEKDHQLTLTSPFNYLITKKRLMMMTKKTNLTTKRLKLTALVPMILIVLFFASERSIAQDTDYDFHEELKKVIDRDSNGPGITAEEETRLKSLITKYKRLNVGRFGGVDEEVEETKEARGMRREIVDLLFKMTDEQKKGHRIILYRPLGVEKKVPTVKQMEKWEKSYPGVFGVLVDGELVDNRDLAEYSNTDFSYWHVIRPVSTRETYYGVYDYVVTLMSNEEYREKNKKASKFRDEYFLRWY